VTLSNPTEKQIDRQKYVFLQGGLGNQLFQISLHYWLLDMGYKSKVCPILLNVPYKNVTRRKFETKHFFSKEEIARLLPFISFMHKKILNLGKIYIEDDLYKLSNNKLQTILESDFLLGYFQSYRLVDRVYEYLRNKLAIKLNFMESNNNLGIHIRGKDYLKSKNKDFHGASTVEYYEQCINVMNQFNRNINRITIYTDDLNYAQSLFGRIKHENFMEFQSSTNPWEDLDKLKSHRYLILTNSSFSWWAGYMAHREYGAKVIFPKMWTSDLKTKKTELMHPAWKII
jgi:hypothetical protein